MEKAIYIDPILDDWEGAMLVAGKVMVVTGAGGGIGRETALELLRRGASVAGVDLNEAGLRETVALAGERGASMSVHALNVADRAAVLDLPEAVGKAHGRVDGLVNVAGIIHKFKRVNDLDFSEIERVVNVNLWGPFNLAKAFIPKLLAQPEAHILNVSSMGAYAPVPGQTVYGATKAAVRLLTEGLRSELLDTRVGVTTVFPGAISTNIAVNSGAASAADQARMAESGKGIKMTTPQVAAKLIVDGIERNAFHVFVGADAKLMCFLMRVIPEKAARMIYTKMRSLLA